MIKSYIKFAFRNFISNKTFSLINVLGLSIAFALFILLFLYITSELSTDKHIENVENIYCLVEKNRKHIFTGGMFATYIHERYPEIKQVCRSYRLKEDILFDDATLASFDYIRAVDSNYFDIFINRAISGNLEDALKEKNGMVLTERVSKALFGNKNPIGKTVKLNRGKNKYYDFIVNAVISDLPENSSYKADFFISILSLLELYEGMLMTSENWTITTFVEVENKTNIPLLEKKLSIDLLERFNRDTNWGLHAYKDIYFNYEFRDSSNKFKHGNIRFVILLIGISVFIIVIASINYINLTTACSGKRAREVGVRKVTGAYQDKLIIQFLIESILLIFISLAIGFFLAELFIGEFNRLVETNLQVKNFYVYPFNILFIIGAILLGVFSGLYPAYVLTSFKTAEIIKGKISSGKRGMIVRKLLTIFQFSMSFIMIVGTIVIYLQLHYVKHSDLGFKKENIVRLDTKDRLAFINAQDLKNELLTIPGVEKVSFCTGIPGDPLGGIYDEIDGQAIEMRQMICDHEYLDLMDIQVVNGRKFSKDNEEDLGKTYIINEAAVKAFETFGWQNPYEIKIWGLKLIGIVEDFNFASLHKPITPLFIMYNANFLRHIVIKISGSNISKTLINIEKAWLKKYPNNPFEFEFVDQFLDQQYKSEEHLGSIVNYFSGFALFIACIGLLGMTSYMVHQRRHEIAVRKVLGGSVKKIINMLTFEHIKLVFIAFVLSVPLSYYIMKTWLDSNFVYRVELSWWVFLISGFIVLTLTIITVCIQVNHAATANPVDSLRSE